MRLQICGNEVAEQYFLKSCGLADAEVVASNCGIATADIKKGCMRTPLPNENKRTKHQSNWVTTALITDK
jgi:hypothetical protein